MLRLLINKRMIESEALVQLGFKINGAEIVKTGVQSGAVVEGLDVIEDGGASFGAGGEALMIDEFVSGAAQGVLVPVTVRQVGATPDRPQFLIAALESPLSGCSGLSERGH